MKLPEKFQDIPVGTIVSYEDHDYWSLLIDYFGVVENDVLRTIHFRKVKFVKVKGRVFRNSSNFFMFLSTPVFEQTGFRIIPNFVRYAISENGDIIIREGYPSNSVGEYSVNGYLTKEVYCQFAKRVRSVHKHRLLALAWVKNDDWTNSTIVNHKDGVKLNLSLDNLEWSSYAKNNRHAFESGLRTDCIKVVMRDVLDGGIYIYHSISNAAEDKGIHASAIHTAGKGRIYGLAAGRYEVRLGNDSRPWFFIDNDHNLSYGKFLLVVKEKDTAIARFGNLSTFMARYKPTGITGSKTVDKVAKWFRNEYPHLTLEITNLWLQKRYQLKLLSTGQVFEENSFNALVTKSGFSVTEIKQSFGKGPSFSNFGFQVREASFTPWPEPMIGETRVYDLINSDGEVVGTFETVNAVARELNLTRFVVKNAVRRKTSIVGYFVKSRTVRHTR